MVRPSPLLQNFLNLIKNFLCDDWLVLALVQFFRVAKQSSVKRIGKDKSRPRLVDSLSAAGKYPALRQKVAYIFQSSVAGGVILKSRFDNFCFLAVNNYGFVSNIIYISNRRNARILAPTDFLAQTTLGIFGKRIHIVFALPKGDIEHELSL